VVGNPGLKTVAANNPKQMKLINVMARLLDEEHEVNHLDTRINVGL